MQTTKDTRGEKQGRKVRTNRGMEAGREGTSGHTHMGRAVFRRLTHRHANKPRPVVLGASNLSLWSSKPHKLSFCQDQSSALVTNSCLKSPTSNSGSASALGTRHTLLPPSRQHCLGPLQVGPEAPTN